MLGAGSSPVSLGGEVCAGPAKRSRGRKGAPGTRERGARLPLSRSTNLVWRGQERMRRRNNKCTIWLLPLGFELVPLPNSDWLLSAPVDWLPKEHEIGTKNCAHLSVFQHLACVLAAAERTCAFIYYLIPPCSSVPRDFSHYSVWNCFGILLT